MIYRINQFQYITGKVLLSIKSFMGAAVSFILYSPLHLLIVIDPTNSNNHRRYHKKVKKGVRAIEIKATPEEIALLLGRLNAKERKNKEIRKEIDAFLNEYGARGVSDR